MVMLLSERNAAADARRLIAELIVIPARPLAGKSHAPGYAAKARKLGRVAERQAGYHPEKAKPAK